MNMKDGTAATVRGDDAGGFPSLWAMIGLVVIALPLVGLFVANAGRIIGADVWGWEQRGQFGDMFGLANALFSGLAFAVLIQTLRLQRKELALQREELRETRAELKRSASAQEASEKALRAQANASEASSRLAAVNYLLEACRVELSRARDVDAAMNHPLAERRKKLRAMEAELLGALERAFERTKAEGGLN